MPRIHSAILIGVCLYFFAAVPAIARDQPGPPRPGVLFTGTEIPRPPQAGKEWKAPETSLPATWVSAVRLLLSYGFADPRGCEYREVELTCGRVSSSKSVLETTHAWVLPRQESDPPDAPRFAVAWNGIVYPVVSVGAPADLQADVQKQLKSDPGSFIHEEPVQVSFDLAVPLKGCLLLILGEADLAEKIWKLAPPHPRSGPMKPQDLNYDPYVELVYEWAWAQHDHAVCAHLRGDDVLSLDSAKPLVALRDAVDKEAVARGFKRPLSSRGQRDRSFVEFLDPVHVLAEDAARRVAAKPVERVLAPGAAPIADQAARIAALIRDLEIVNETQHMQPGGVKFDESLLVEALVNEGLPAVEPLLDCLEHDQRLTRSVQFHRDFAPGREYITVKRPAFAALQEILKTRTFGETAHHVFVGGIRRREETPQEIERRQVALKEIRDFYQKTLTRSEAERWFSILAWDKSSEEEWLEAAQHLVEPARPDPTQLTEVLEADETPRLLGEPVRQRRDPSVIGLLDRRAELLAGAATSDVREIRDFQVACRRFQMSCRLSSCLAKWDRPYGLPECRRRLQQYRAVESVPEWQPWLPQLYGDVSRLFTVGVEAGDEEFIDGYIAWMTRLTPDPSSLTIGLDVFQPLSRAPDNKKLWRLSVKLFSTGSPWLPIDRQLGPRWYGLLTSPLIAVPTFRRHVSSKLNNKTPFGTATLDPDALIVKVRFAGGQRSAEVSTAFGRDEPPPGPQAIRFCDFVAWRLSGLEGAPRFEPWWSETRRDAALKLMSEFLDRWGPAFRESGPPVEEFGGPSHKAKFRLPKLDAPATEEDVEAGRAIFSLRKEGAEVRLVPLPTRPQAARWKTLTDFPVQTLGPVDPATGKPTRVKAFDQEGVIWQAEEVLVEGVWRRYYGFVGRHVVGRVPAEEVELSGAD